MEELKMGTAPKAGKLIMHFGMPKTGTSSIQESLFQRLSDPNFYYVNFGNANASYSLVTAFRENPARFHAHIKRGSSSEQLQQISKLVTERLNAEIRRAGARTAILSAEAIARFKTAEISKLHDFLACQRDSVEAVGYFRQPKEYMESAFQQSVKAGHCAFVLPKLLPSYRNFVEMLDATLGQNNVKTWLFDPPSFPEKCVVQDFCGRLGINLHPAAVIRVNDGLSVSALSLLYIYRKFGPGYGTGPTVIRENKLLIGCLRTLAGPKLRFHSSIVGPVIRQRSADIRWMEKRLGKSLAEEFEADDDFAIHAESDLLKVAPETGFWLAEQLGPDFVKKWRPDIQLPEVASWMHALRLKLASSDKKVQAIRQNSGPRNFQEDGLISGFGIGRQNRELAILDMRGKQSSVSQDGYISDDSLLQIAGAKSASSVIWIASYPKSGNTWVQSVVRQAGKPFGFPGRDLDVYKLTREKRLPDVVGGIQPTISRAATTVLKTHNRYILGRNLHPELRLQTVGFIYVMRNPLDMLLSYINFTRMQYEKRKESSEYQEALFVDLLGYDEAVPYKEWVNTKLEDIPRSNLDHALSRFIELNTLIPGIRMAEGSWLEHCLSWIDAAKTLPCVLLKYEDLLQGENHFFRLSQLFTFSEIEICNAVREVNDRQRGKQNQTIFFNKMSAYYYPQFFSADVLAQFFTRFEKELRHLGYGEMPGLV